MKRIINRWGGYTLQDLDCKYCLYYGGHMKGEIICTAKECVCKDELKEIAQRKKPAERGNLYGSKNQ